MNLSTATSVTGGILLGIILLVIGIIIWFVFLMLKKRKKSIAPKHGGKSGYVVGGIGLAIVFDCNVSYRYNKWCGYYPFNYEK